MQATDVIVFFSLESLLKSKNKTGETNFNSIYFNLPDNKYGSFNT